MKRICGVRATPLYALIGLALLIRTWIKKSPEISQAAQDGNLLEGILGAGGVIIFIFATYFIINKLMPNKSHKPSYKIFLEAIKDSDIESVTILLKANLNLVAEKDEHGYTLLHHAAKSNEVEIAELLLINGADVNAKSIYGETPIMFAESKPGYENMVELLQGRKSTIPPVIYL